MKIETIDDWWDAVAQQWNNLLGILEHHLDFKAPAYENPGHEESPLTGRNILGEMVHLKETRDQKLARYFFAAWYFASETYARSRPPGWNTLCDLLSEEWVFGES